MSEAAVAHWWMSLSEAGRYANINPDILRGAIIAGELDAYEKPVTHSRKPGASRRNALIRLCRSDVDAYIRKHWRKADASTFGVPLVASEMGETRRA